MSEDLPEDLNDLARSLRSLRPRCDLPNRDRLMFEAGRRSKRNRFWPAVSGVLSVALAFSLTHHAVVPEQDRIAVAPTQISVPELVARNPEPDVNLPGLLQTRNTVLRWGVDAMPEIKLTVSDVGPPTQPLTPRLHGETISSILDERGVSTSRKVGEI